MLWWLIIIVIIIVAAIFLSFVWTKLTAPGFKVEGKHVFITGGSTGLGLGTAKQYAKAGAKVSIVARSMEKLEAAKLEIEAVAKNKDDAIFIRSTDVTDYEAVQLAIEEANAFHGRVTDHVVCCAGVATPGYFVEQDISVFRSQMDLNYFGVVHTVKAAAPAMIKADNHGKIVIVSSACALVSFIGYTQYAASKFALRGLAEALRNEFKLYGIDVTMYYPANIDSPGFIEENKTKPEECVAIEGQASLQHPDKVAQTLVGGLSNGEYAITNDLLIELIRWGSNGIAPRWNTPLELLLQPLVFLVTGGLRWYSDSVVSKARKPTVVATKTASAPVTPVSATEATAADHVYHALPDERSA